MGKVRPVLVKRTARELLEQYRDRFTTDFEHNKQVLDEVTKLPSKKIRNRVAGYIVRLLKRKAVEKEGGEVSEEGEGEE